MPTSNRLTVLKTSKLYIGGRFVRTESGRSLPVLAADGSHLSHYCWASRKDARETVRAARGAQSAWAASSAYLRGQILYRMAEMLEERGESFEKLLTQTGVEVSAARREVSAAVDRLVYFAGWSDKITAVFGSVNPVSSPHFNFTTPEPTGVVALFCPARPSLLGLVTLIGASLVMGNALVVLVSETDPLPGAAFAEVLATSDVPAGVVNLLTGKADELAPVLADHLDVNAIVAAGMDEDTRRCLAEGAGRNLKRVHLVDLKEDAWYGEAGEDPYRILQTVEMKTAWHPVGF